MSGRTHYTQAEAHGMERAARLATEFGDADMLMAEKAKAANDEMLANIYAEKAARSYLIAGAIRVKARQVAEGQS